MKSLKSDIKTKAYEIGENTSKVAEAVQTDLAYQFAEILNNPKIDAGSVEEAYKIMEQNTRELMRTALAGFEDISDEVLGTTSALFGNSLKQAKKMVKIDAQDEIKRYLFRITGDQIIEGHKIAYRNGRKIGYKEYIEMATRTRIQHELLEQEKEFGEITKQLFYVSDTYSDCANDHIHYQGQLYYDAKVWASIPRTHPYYDQLRRGIAKCKASVEDVTTKEPYLCTRPNCRHRLIPVAIDDVIDMSIKQILAENKADKGNYSTSVLKKNYDDSQKQRRLEYAVRTAKRNVEIMQRAYEKTKDTDYLKAVNRYAFSIRSNQAKLRKLTELNSTLKRDYRRENPFHLQKDLGVAYNSAPVRARVDIPTKDFDDVVEWQRGLTSGRLDDFKKTIAFIDKSNNFFDNLSDDEKLAIRRYTGTDYIWMNKMMLNREEAIKSIKDFANTYNENYDKILERTLKKIDDLHSIFAKLKNADITTNKALVVYRGGRDVIGEDDTTVIFNSFTSSSIDTKIADDFLSSKISTAKAGKNYVRYKIIIPPKAQNQALYNNRMKEDEVIIDTNSVYDIIAEEVVEIIHDRNKQAVKQYTLLMRPKHAGVKR